MRLFDTHAHLTDESFDADREKLLDSLHGSGIALVMEIACDVREAEASMALTEKYPYIYAAVGMHPHIAHEVKNEHIDSIKEFLKREKAVAVGEIGLDYHYDFSPREIQKKWFVEQLELAKELRLPVSLHIREAFGDCMDILRAHKNGLKGVMHCFSGSLETAFECVDLGLYIALGGAVTFKNAKRPLSVAEHIPLDRIVVETDCPYLTPEPYRGRRNDPSMVRYTVERIAEVRRSDPESIAEATYQNGLEAFGLELKE
ncbi:MAG: putative deoxyribonuclease YcfH [Firmicutes bacterium ADurb.Bin182]|nr:MAG: putative deoxyribonuclease YcfH [Firmicutes bacterium ADurb.Bin182]